MLVGVMGAGAIGCYIGGRLLAAGTPVVLVGRPSLAAEVAVEGGLRLTDYHGFDRRIEASIATSPDALGECDVVLVTVKSGDTAAVAATLGGLLRPEAVAVSFQNGVSNPAALEEAGLRVLPGMVPFNVLRKEGAHFHQGTSGNLALPQDPAALPLADALIAAGLPVRLHEDMQAVLWGKLLLNLNNAVNALLGVPIKEMIGSRDCRLLMAAVVHEGVEALRRAEIRPVLDMPLPARLLPWVLSLPNWLFRLVAKPMIQVDPHARSSMWDDLERGRTTEVDALNGEVVRLAERHGGEARANAAIVQLVKAAEGKGSPGLSASELGKRLYESFPADTRG